MYYSRGLRLLLSMLFVFSALAIAPIPQAQASTYNSVSFRGRADSGGVTTILTTPCGTGSKLQLRSERPGVWISEIFNRTGNPACSDAWQIVFRAPSNDNGVYNIYSYMGDAYLSETEFMQRAWRHECRINGLGNVTCVPLADPTAPRLALDAPAEGQSITGDATFSGWAADAASRAGTGVDQVEIVLTAGGADFNLGAVSYGLTRGDVAGALGDSRFTNTGYNQTVNLDAIGVPPGPATITVRARSTISGSWTQLTRAVTIVRGGPPVGLCSSAQYVAQYFNNRDLSGSPVRTECENAIDYEWGDGGPGAPVPPTNFSVRWVKTERFATGEYTFLARFDDGYRVWIDDVLVVDRWFDQVPVWRSEAVNLTEGDHTIKVEYYNGLLVSVARFRYLLTPTLARVAPSSKVANAEAVPVIIRGEHFQSPLTVTINGVPLTDVTVIDPTTISAVVPPALNALGTYDVVVDVSGYRMILPRAFSISSAVPETQIRAMFVLACDNDLVENCKSAVDGLEAALSRSSDLRIVLLWDGPGVGDSAYYLLTPNTTPGWSPNQYTDNVNRWPQGELNTGSYHTLAEFAGWAQAEFPGRYKLLNLYGHGGGWAPQLHPGQPSGGRTGVKASPQDVGGMLWDDHPESTLPTVSLTKALQAVTAAYNLDLLYLDACLMSMIEVHSELAPYASYIMAHENVTWASVGAYEDFFAGVSATTTPQQLMEQIARVSRAAWPQALHPNQLSVVDTAGMALVQERLDRLAVTLIAGLGSQRPAISAVALATARVDGNSDYRITTTDPFIDARDFAQRLSDHPSISADIKGAARDFITALNGAVKINERLGGRIFGREDIFWDLDQLGGQSLFFPSQVDDWRRQAYNTDNLPNFARNTRWDEFLNAWYPNQPAPPVPTERCDTCLSTPLRVGLTIDSPTLVKLGQTSLVPVALYGITPGDGLHGLQIEVTTSDAQVLAPDTESDPDMGPVFPKHSLSDSAVGPTSWSYIINTPARTSDPVTQTGVVVYLPFHGQSEGCATLTFTVHKLSSLDPSPIAHQAFGERICVREKALVQGFVFLEERAPGQYHGATVTLSQGRRTYKTTTDAQGYFIFPKVDEGTYTLSVSQALYVKARRQINAADLAGINTGQIGLWAGDLDQDQQVDWKDWNICAAASIPVSDPRFDINLDGVTDIADCTIVRRNIKRPNMDSENPPHQPQANVLHSAQEQARLDAGLLPVGLQAAAAPSIRLEGGALVVRPEELAGVTAFGVRIRLLPGVQAGPVTGQGVFAGQFLSAHQEGDLLYIIAALPAGETAGADTVIARIEGVDGGEVEASNFVRPALTNLLYLPLVRR